MDKSTICSKLVEFAEERLHAAMYRDCRHPFHLYKCARCESISLAVTVERYEHDMQGDFHGVLRTRCADCGHVATAFRMLRQGSAPIAPVVGHRCICRSDVFHVGLCERWEDWGFFDESTIVAMCAACRRIMAVADID